MTPVSTSGGRVGPVMWSVIWHKLSCAATNILAFTANHQPRDNPSPNIPATLNAAPAVQIPRHNANFPFPPHHFYSPFTFWHAVRNTSWQPQTTTRKADPP